MPTFTWSPRTSATKEIAPRVRKASFGDGYTQRVADGINTQLRAWSLEFVRPEAEADAIEAFLVARAATEAFDWTDPNGYAAKWVCESWRRSEMGRGVATISTSFMEAPGT